MKVRGIYMGPPKDMGPPSIGKGDPYYSHTIPISLGILDWEWDYGIVWGKVSPMFFVEERFLYGKKMDETKNLRQ